MHSSAFGAAARMVFRSFSSAARLSALRAARYSSMVFGLAAMAVAREKEVPPLLFLKLIHRRCQISAAGPLLSVGANGESNPPTPREGEGTRGFRRIWRETHACRYLYADRRARDW